MCDSVSELFALSVFIFSFSLLLLVIIWVSWWIPQGNSPQWKTRIVKYGLILQVLLSKHASAHSTQSIRGQGEDVTGFWARYSVNHSVLCLQKWFSQHFLHALVDKCVWFYLDGGAGGAVGLFSVDSSDPPIVSGPLSAEQYPSRENNTNHEGGVFAKLLV